MSKNVKRFVYNVRWKYHQCSFKIIIKLCDMCTSAARKHVGKQQEMISNRKKELGLV